MLEDEITNDAGILEALAKDIHYPDCWDTVAYPSLYYAIIELWRVGPNCPICEEPQGHQCNMRDNG